MKQLPGGNIRPLIVIQPLPRQKRRAWWPWVVVLLVVILALVSQFQTKNAREGISTANKVITGICPGW